MTIIFHWSWLKVREKIYHLKCNILIYIWNAIVFHVFSVDGKYASQGKLGAAILANHIDKEVGESKSVIVYLV